MKIDEKLIDYCYCWQARKKHTNLMNSPNVNAHFIFLPTQLIVQTYTAVVFLGSVNDDGKKFLIFNETAAHPIVYCYRYGVKNLRIAKLSDAK
jgi:hypothetical protein